MNSFVVNSEHDEGWSKGERDCIDDGGAVSRKDAKVRKARKDSGSVEEGSSGTTGL